MRNLAVVGHHEMALGMGDVGHPLWKQVSLTDHSHHINYISLNYALSHRAQKARS